MELKPFLSAHIVKGDGVIYNGKSDQLPSCVDGSFADIRFENSKKHLDWKPYHLQIFWEEENIYIPVFENKSDQAQKITEEYKKSIVQYQKLWVLGDKRSATIYKLLDYFDVRADWEAVGFIERVAVEDSLLKQINERSEFNVDESNISITIEQHADIWRYENAILLLKEVKEGYYDVRSHSLVDKMNGKYVQQDYKIGQDVYMKLNTKTGEVIESTQTETQYWADRQKEWRFIVTPDWERINTSEFKPYTIKEDGEILEVWLIWAYTHILREVLKFNPITWQYKFLLNFMRLNFIAGCRRSGKTMLSSYLILRELRRMPNSIKHSQRTVKTLYIAPTEDKQKEVVDYIKTASEQIRILKVIDFNKKENRLYLYDEKVWRNQKTQIVVSTCDFASGKWFEPGRGKASDFVIIDEAAFVPEDVWLNILPILENEKAKLFCISTIDWETTRNWFYEQLIDSERGYDLESYGFRVTIDDIDNKLISDESKDRMKRALKNNRQRYYAELYATFPDMKQVFNTDGFFLINKNDQDTCTWYLFGYDPAKRSDIWALLVGKVMINKNTWTKRIQLIEEHALQWEYVPQREYVQNVRQFYAQEGVPQYLTMDATWWGDSVSEIFWALVDYKVWYTPKGKRPSVDAFGVRKVAKTNLVHLAQILIESWKIKAHISLTKLMDELKNFKAFKWQSDVTKYEAETGHDDFVNAMMMIAFYFGYIDWQIYTLSSAFGMDRINVIDWVSNETWLYNEFTERMTFRPDKKPWAYGFGV